MGDAAGGAGGPGLALLPAGGLTEKGLGCVTLPKSGELRARQQQGKLLSVRVPAVLGLPEACPALFGFIPSAVLPLQAFGALH